MEANFSGNRGWAARDRLAVGRWRFSIVTLLSHVVTVVAPAVSVMVVVGAVTVGKVTVGRVTVGAVKVLVPVMVLSMSVT